MVGMKAKKAAKPGLIVNTQARRDYELQQTYQAGISLSGAEVKSLRTGHGHLRGAFVNLKDGELWLYNATVNATNANRSALPESAQTRARKLLVKKRELAELVWIVSHQNTPAAPAPRTARMPMTRPIMRLSVVRRTRRDARSRAADRDGRPASPHLSLAKMAVGLRL